MSSRGIGARFVTLGGGEVLARLSAFAATIYLARTLSPALYGIVGVAMGIMLYLSQVADGGIELVGVPLVARAGREVAALAQPMLAVRVVLSLVLALLVIAAGVTVLPQPDGAILAISALALLFSGLSVRWIHIGLERANGVAIARTLGEVVALLAIVALVHDAGDVALVPLAQFLGAAVTAFILLYSLQRSGLKLVWQWAPRLTAPIFRRSQHLVVFTLLGLLLFNFDLIYLRFRTGAEAAGYYAAAYTMISFAANLIVAFAHTVLPNLTRLEDDIPQRSELYETVCAQAYALALPVGAGAWYVSTQVIEQVFGGAYLPGVIALQWLAFTIPLAALRELPVVALIAAGRERTLIRVNAITAACNVVLVLLTVPRYGLAGAAGATVATEFIRLVLASHFARAAGYPVVPLRRLLKATAATVAMVGALVTLAPGVLWTSLPVGVGVYAVVMMLMGGVQLRRRIPVLSV
ncbi:MAG: oligosaccharide flippase family protein [Gemmatimonadaceae bacterium]